MRHCSESSTSSKFTLNSLIDDKVEERKDLDYKRDLPERNDEKKREFLSDISSFANTVGGI